MATILEAGPFASLIVTTFVFIFVLILDMVIIERKKILRFVGHNLDHVLFMGLILGAIFVIMKGSVI